MPRSPKKRLRSSRASKQSLAEPDSATQDPFSPGCASVPGSKKPKRPLQVRRLGGFSGTSEAAS